MPEPGKSEMPKLPMHLTCPSCLTPMRIRTAEAADGRDRIQFVCANCGTEAVRDRKSL